MSATNRAIPFDSEVPKSGADYRAQTQYGLPQSFPILKRVPSLCVKPLLTPTQSRRFPRVPTHAVGVFPEQRQYPRASLQLPLRLRSVNHVAESFPITLVTRDISSTGVFFLSPKELPMNTLIELEVVLVSRPMGRGNVVIASHARVSRVERAAMPGWYGVAASFDDVEFGRDDDIPTRFEGF